MDGKTDFLLEIDSVEHSSVGEIDSRYETFGSGVQARCSLAQAPASFRGGDDAATTAIHPKLSVFSADLIYFISLSRGPNEPGICRPPPGVQGHHFGVIYGHFKKVRF